MIFLRSNGRNGIFVILISSVLFTACGSKDGLGDNDLPTCGETQTFFTVSPISQDSIRGLVGLGNLNPSGHVFPTDHIYLYMNDKNSDDIPEVVDVSVPGHGYVTEVTISEHVSDGFTDYGLAFNPCNEYTLSFGHLSALNDGLLAHLSTLDSSLKDCSTYQTGGKTFTNCRYHSVAFEMAAGQNLGQAGGNKNQFGLDLGARDLRRKPLEFANNQKIDQANDMIRYTVCPIDAFEAGLRKQLEDRFSNYNSTVMSSAEPRCGRIDQDVVGTAQGMWFKVGASFYPEDPHLALVHDNVDPKVGALSMGTSLGSDAQGAHHFKPETSGPYHREWSTITPGDTVYCYESESNTGGIFLVKLVSQTELLVEYQKVDDCLVSSLNLTSNAVTFVR